jgi:hypothetical protein
MDSVTDANLVIELQAFNRVEIIQMAERRLA